MKNQSRKWFNYLQFGLTFLCLCLLCLGQLERWQLNSGVAIYGHDVVIAISLLVNWRWWLDLKTKLFHHFNWQKHRLEIILVSWIILGWVLSISSGYLLTSAFLYVARLIMYAAFNWQLVHQTWWSSLFPWLDKKQRLPSFYWVTGIFLMLCGFLQFVFLPDLRFLGILGWDNSLYRLASVQLDPNITGALLVLTLLMTLNLKVLKMPLKTALAILLTIAIALTYSRSSYLAFGGGLLSWAFFHRKIHQQVILALGLILLLAISLPMLPRPGGEGVRLERTATGQARLDTATGVFKEMTPVTWIVGRGIFRPVVLPVAGSPIAGQHAQQPDNLLVLLLIGLGIGGTVIFLALVWKYRFEVKKFSPLLIASLVAVGLHSQFNNTLFQPFVWLIVTGMLVEHLNTSQSGD